MDSIHRFLAWALILSSSVLLGIWAIKGTIALRNSLLGLETILSIMFCYRFFKKSNQKISLKHWIPIIMLGLIFGWVIMHYLFLSRHQDIQLHELKSTWFRAFLASIVGFGTGLAALKSPKAVNCLWIGILTSFICLLFQYAPLAISTNNINYHGYELFIYPGKISGVLMGTLLIAGLLGALLDRLPYLDSKLKFSSFLFWLFGTCLVLYAYVFIFDTRNGLGIAIILYFLVFVFYIAINGWDKLV